MFCRKPEQISQLSLQDLAYTGERNSLRVLVTELSPRDVQSERATHLSEEVMFQGQSVFRISPLIWITLWCLYLALTVPLPLLSNLTTGGISAKWLLLAIPLGGIVLHAALSEQVILDQQGIRVSYPFWVPSFFRGGWCLSWIEIQDLKPRSTSQGGLVYYLLSTSGQAYLLPMRVAGFARLVRQVEARTGIDTTSVRPLAQPWMYLTLLLFTLMLFLADGWIIATTLG